MSIFFSVPTDTTLWVPNFPQTDIAYPGNHFHAYATTLELALVYVPHGLFILALRPFPISIHRAKPFCRCRSNKCKHDLFSNDHRGRAYIEQRHRPVMYCASRRDTLPMFLVPSFIFLDCLCYHYSNILSSRQEKKVPRNEKK